METIKLNENKLYSIISESVVEVLKEMKEEKEAKPTTVKLTEEELRNIVTESTLRILKESDMDEGWFGDKFNQVKSAGNTLFQKNKEMGLKDRMMNTRKNWKSQGELNDMNNLVAMLTKLLDAKQVAPTTTVAQLVGGKYNNNKFGTMSGMVANRKAQIANRGGKSF